MDKDLIYLVLVINLAVSVIYYIQKRCEVPLFLALFNVLVQYRMISLELGLSQFVNFDYQIDFIFNFDIAYQVCELILLGTSVMMYTFIFLYKPVKIKFQDTNEDLKVFLLQRKTYIFAGLLFFSVFQIGFSDSISEGYGNLSKLANSSFIILFFLIYLFINKSNLQVKVLYMAIFVVIGYISYSPEMRFQFLGWMIPIGYYLTRNIKPRPKLLLMAGGLFMILVIFSAARVLRYTRYEQRSLSADELYEESYDRLQESDDVNFIDGFMMMYQVYPRYLDHTYGLDHLNILLRPIPRTLWPDKPLAGWFQNFQEKYGLEQIRVGFSPTLYGVFYAEMGTVGIVAFSVLWGYFLVWMYRYLSAFKSDLSFLLVGILLTAMIPVFRSGDLAGDVAIVLMSYWPIIYFVYKYKIYVQKRIRRES